MTGDRKSSDLTSRLSVKRGARLISKASKASGTISSPPKAAIAAPNAKQDEVHHRRNPFNDMLRRGSGGDNHKVVLQSSSSEALKKAPSPPPSEDDQHGQGAARVLELERALAIAKEEQDTMRQELEAFRQHARLDQDTMESLGHQLDETRQDTESVASIASSEHGSDIEIISPTERPDEDLLRQNFELRYRVAQLQEQLVGRESTQHGRASLREEAEWNGLRFRLHAAEKESQERLQQLLSLKSSISSLTRMDSQITDSELAESISQLANRVREWVISNYRRSKLDLDHLPQETREALVSVCPNYMAIDAVDRLALYQGIVGSKLAQILQEHFVVGLPASTSAAIRPCAEVIHGAGSEYREWKRATIRAIEKSSTSQTLHQGREDALQRLAGVIAHLLFTFTSVSLTTTAQSALMGILITAADLQRAIVLQKAQYQIIFFRNVHGQSVGFDDRRMESINDLLDEDGDTATERRFLFCVFPCIEKHGDERGEHLETSNVLLKARICCDVG